MKTEKTNNIFLSIKPNIVKLKVNDNAFLYINNINGKWIITPDPDLSTDELNYLNEKGELLYEFLARKPALIVLKVTDECNMRCRYCYYNAGLKQRGRLNEQLINKIVKFVEELVSSYKVRYITIEFHGGEPFLHVDLIEKTIKIIDSKLDNKVKVSYATQTNGTIINKHIIDLIRSYFNNTIGISIDGPAYIHDKNRVLFNSRPSHRLVENNIKKLLNADIRVGALAVFTHYGIGYEKDIVKYFYELGIESFKLNPVINQGRASNVFNEIGVNGKEFAHSYIQVLELIEDINNNNDKNIYEDNFIEILKKILGAKPRNICYLTPCGAGSLILYVEPNGIIKACDHLPFILGNLNHSSVQKIIKNIENFKKVFINSFVRMYNSACFQCPWFYICSGGCRGFARSLNEKSQFHCDFYRIVLKYVFTRIAKDPHIVYKWIPYSYRKDLKIQEFKKFR